MPSFFLSRSRKGAKEKMRLAEPEKINVVVVPGPSNKPCLRSQSSKRSSTSSHVSFSDSRPYSLEPGARPPSFSAPEIRSFRRTSSSSSASSCASVASSSSRSSSTSQRSSSSSASLRPATGIHDAPAFEQCLREFTLDQALEELGRIQSELKDLKQLMTDFSAYSKNTHLNKAMIKLATNKRAELKEKLDTILFDGEDSHLFNKMKENLRRSLDSISTNWTEAGQKLISVDLSQRGEQLECKGRREARADRASSRRSNTTCSRSHLLELSENLDTVG